MSHPKHVVVTGDLIWDHNLVQHPAEPSYHHEPFPSTVMHRQRGGAWYLEQLVRAACGDLIDAGQLQVTGELRDEIGHSGPWASRAYSLWSQHQRRIGGGGPVWRVSRFLGCQPATGENEVSAALSPPDGRVDVLVIEDLCLGFRHRETLWARALDRFSDPSRIVLKTTSPLGGGPLWSRLLDQYRDRLTVVLPVAVLRARGAAIGQGTSWDRAIEEVVQEFEHGPSAHDLARCRRVFVHFGAGAIAAFRRRTATGGGIEFERFVFHPEEQEDSWRSLHPGQTFGAASIVTAAVVRFELDRDTWPLFPALARGLAALRENHRIGVHDFDVVDPEDPIDVDVKRLLRPGSLDEDPANEFFAAFPHYLLTDDELKRQPAQRSNLLQDLTGARLDDVAATATEVVLCGPDVALRAVPKARYGHYLTVDREEIERINAIRSLITAYRKNAEDRRPLSIAVFGPPGSGKSFAIKQLASELFGADNELLEFNLSQFEGVADLHSAFHRVRDAAVHGRIPLVFWDEFDSDELRWLAHFLAPMQDAAFRAANVMHPFGKAIFVFAGGTASSFEAFAFRSDSYDTEFRRRKGPDLISRLRGFVDIKGPNPTEKKGPKGDPAHFVRRAMLLRSSIVRLYPHLIDGEGRTSVSPSVIRGFLRVRELKHGARSLETVVAMSDLAEASHYGIAELPTADSLQLHVTNDFMDHVRAGQIEAPVIEALAVAGHAAWRARREASGWRPGPRLDVDDRRDPRLRPYTELGEKHRELARQHARRLRARLAAAGLTIEPRNQTRHGGGVVLEAVPSATRREVLEMAHDHWLRGRLLAGYARGPASAAIRFDRRIVSFSTLEPGDMPVDGEILDRLPAVLAEHGFALLSGASR